MRQMILQISSGRTISSQQPLQKQWLLTQNPPIGPRSTRPPRPPVLRPPRHISLAGDPRTPAPVLPSPVPLPLQDTRRRSMVGPAQSGIRTDVQEGKRRDRFCLRLTSSSSGTRGASSRHSKRSCSGQRKLRGRRSEYRRESLIGRWRVVSTGSRGIATGTWRMTPTLRARRCSTAIGILLFSRRSLFGPKVELECGGSNGSAPWQILTL